MQAPRSVLALDVGARRIGVAVASETARLAHPVITLHTDDTLWIGLEQIVEVENVRLLVVGFPRGLRGQVTAQTQAIEAFVTELRQHFPLPIVMQDEALTSKHAEAELQARGKLYTKEEVDALAATYILEDYLTEHKELVFDESL
ncbi:MAG TPA: Holliday junction resolvase RuvX [Candidatus Saccharimonadales bacterium]|nr:Holliday junction resolvase RuvX [Candidatus Saccharimonadales bacterium]